MKTGLFALVLLLRVNSLGQIPSVPYFSGIVLYSMVHILAVRDAVLHVYEVFLHILHSCIHNINNSMLHSLIENSVHFLMHEKMYCGKNTYNQRLYTVYMIHTIITIQSVNGRTHERDAMVVMNNNKNYP
jgi:hypothetical protein